MARELPCALYLLVNGRVMGASGILGGLVDGSGRDSRAERLSFVAGLVGVPLIVAHVFGPNVDLARPAAATGRLTALVTAGILVGVGTREAYLAIRSDDQLENRFQPFPLPRWEPDGEARSLLASFAASFPLRRRSSIATGDMARYLLTRSEGTIGELTHLLTDAAVAAIESGEEAINQRTLLLADYTGPSERRRLFERELT
jgi:hypothetical protein